jgi:hypothetical protein
MFWFRSRVERPVPPAEGASIGQDELPGFLPPPLPEVVEGNGEADWALWEASVAAMEEQVRSMAFEAFAGSSRSDLPEASEGPTAH